MHPLPNAERSALARKYDSLKEIIDILSIDGIGPASLYLHPEDGAVAGLKVAVLLLGAFLTVYLIRAVVRAVIIDLTAGLKCKGAGHLTGGKIIGVKGIVL